MLKLLKSKYVLAVILVAVIAIENYFQPGWVVTSWRWTIGFLSTDMQSIAFGVALVALVLAVFLFGWVAVLALALVALWPLTGLHFGELDYWLGDIARKLASNPRDTADVARIFGLLHYGVVVLGTAFVLLLATSLFRPRRFVRREPTFSRRR